MDDENLSAERAKLDTKYDDQPHEMTNGRRIARSLSRYSCYFPSKDKEGGPSLDKAWAYFEHSALPRHHLVHGKKNDIYLKAEYGKVGENTELYSLWKTPEKELGDFGVSVGVYFWNLRNLAIIMIFAGLLSLPNMLYFASSDYGDYHHFLGRGDWLLEGSAICTDSSWVPCPNCTKANWEKFGSHYDQVGSLFFVLKNNCSVRLREGVVTFVTLIFTVIAIMYTITYKSGQRTIQLDVRQQTTSDYAVEVFDPPTDAYDPDVWKEFFSQFGRVHSVTITLDNEKLIDTLVARRTAIRQIKYMMKPDQIFDPDDLENMIKYCEEVPSWKKWICCSTNAESLFEKVRECEEKAKELAKEEQLVSEVFAIFETEKEQRNALNQLSHPGWRRLFGCIPEDLKFDGKSLLVDEAKEPSSIRWCNLDETNFIKTIRLCISYILLFLLISGGGRLVWWMGLYDSVYAAYTITIINQITPRICGLLTSSIESHSSEGAREASLYLKLTIFKWLNTAIITSIISPAINTVDNGKKELITKVSAIFITELVANPALLLLDFFGNLQRHVFGPKAVDQERMDQNFKGAEYFISLRYTEMTKILFLAFFYSTIYPAGLFWAAASLIVNYWVDKWCLFRTYGPAPTIGNQVSVLSRKILFPLMLVIYALMTLRDYAGWPFDNTCDSTSELPDEYIGNHTIFSNKKQFNITITADQLPVKYCLQDILTGNNVSSSTIIEGIKWLKGGEETSKFEWMSQDQDAVTRALGWVFMIMFIFAALVFIREVLSFSIFRFFCQPYSASGKANKKPFSKLKDRFAYTPQVRVSGFKYPLLACNVDEIGPDCLDFEDPDSEYPDGYHKHNLIFDLKLRDDTDTRHLWSIIKNWGKEHRKIPLMAA